MATVVPVPSATIARTETEPMEHEVGMNPKLMSINRTAYLEMTEKDRAGRRKQLMAQSMGTVRAANRFMKTVRSKRTQVSSEVAELDASVGAPSLSPSPSPPPEDVEEPAEGPRSVSGRIMEVLGMPYMLVFKTVPDCRKESLKGWYLITFAMSIVWIALLCYVMVDFGARAGCIIGIPPLVLGLTILAAGTSVPDAMSSVLVAKNGQGDMAVANALGSNVFDILMGLGLPWFLKTVIDGTTVKLHSDGVVMPVLVLMLYIILLISLIAGNGWTVNATMGWALCFSEVVYIVWSLLTLLDNPVIKLPNI